MFNKARLKIYPDSVLREKSFPVKANVDECRKLVPQVVTKPLAAAGQLWRHDSQKLAKTLTSLL